MEWLTTITDTILEYQTASCVVGLTTVAIIVFKFVRRKTPRICGVDYPKDVVILHQFPPTKKYPTLGHFVMKLETYLRVNKIPHQAEHRFQKYAPKSKFPWIEYNGETVADSQFSMEFLNKSFGVDMNAHLSEDERAIAWAIQKWLEESTYFLNVNCRWMELTRPTFEEFLPKHYIWFMPLAKRSIGGNMYSQGVGRHSHEEVQEMIIRDLKHFSKILGKKPYIMGSRMAEVDCTAFGVLVQIQWLTPLQCRGAAMLRAGELKNVSDYLDRIREAYFPEWDAANSSNKKDN